MNSCIALRRLEPAIQIYCDKANTQGVNITDHAQTLAHLEKMRGIRTIVPRADKITANGAFPPSMRQMAISPSLDGLEAVVRVIKARSVNKRGDR